MRQISQVVQRARPRNELRLGLRYGRVLFVLREQFGISAIECLLLDVIDTLSRRTGYCYASRRYLAALLGISIRSLQRMIRRVEAAGLLVPCRFRRQLRTSALWRRAKLSLDKGQVVHSGAANLSTRYQQRYKE